MTSNQILIMLIVGWIAIFFICRRSKMNEPSNKERHISTATETSRRRIGKSGADRLHRVRQFLRAYEKLYLYTLLPMRNCQCEI